MKVLMLGFLLMFIVLINVCAKEITNGSNTGTTENLIDSLLKKVELIPIMVNGKKDNRINIVIMNRWTQRDSEPYNSPKMRDEFIKDINESIIAALTPGDERAQTAYANYREFFNVYGLWYPETPEWGKGIDDKVVDAMRDKLFLPWKNEYLGWVTFLVMPNSNSGGGGAGRNLEDRVGTALIAGNGIGKMLHEIAHTCMSIGDEYTGQATGTSAIPTYNNSAEYERDKIKWSKWIEPDTPLPTPYTEAYKNKIGAFEGTQYHLTGYYRSTAQGCIMGAGIFDNTEKMCPICEQRVAMRVYTLVNPINSFSPSNNSIQIEGKKKVHFEIDHIKPVPNTQVVRWNLNGKTIATNVDEVDVEFGELKEYKLTCSLTDETPFIRPDPPYAKYPTREITWEIKNSAPSSNAADLAVIDSEFRNAKSHFPIFESSINKGGSLKDSKTLNKASGIPKLKVDLTASEVGRNNGKIAVAASGGKEPYNFKWMDENFEYGERRIYEAEDAAIKIPGHTLKAHFNASNLQFVDFNGHEGEITWTIEVVKSGSYPIELVYAAASNNEVPMNISVNNESVNKSLVFYSTRPLFTGWEKATITVNLKEGKNTVSLNSTGKSGANIDYLRVPVIFESGTKTGNKRINLSPGNYPVVVTDGANNSVIKTIAVPEVYPFKISNLSIEKTKQGTLRIVNPLPEYSYKWYAGDAPVFITEKYEDALFVGTEFAPQTPGNYFIAAKNNLTNTESSNRFCFAVGKTPETKIAEVNPTSLGEESIKMWFDASDLDGDENLDGIFPERGPLREWKEKTWRNPGKIFTKYEPNKLNGMGVCAFDNVWISRLDKKVSDFQTIILVYKESTMTLPGKAPFVEMKKYFGKSSNTAKRLFDLETTDAKTKNGKVYLNGKQVDPFNTANPMDYCILTIEFESVVSDPISTIEGNFEGDIAEMIFIDRTLTEMERTGIEEYLRKKWFSSVDLNF